jgi:hypothetical protein
MQARHVIVGPRPALGIPVAPPYKAASPGLARPPVLVYLCELRERPAVDSRVAHVVCRPSGVLVCRWPPYATRDAQSQPLRFRCFLRVKWQLIIPYRGRPVWRKTWRRTSRTQVTDRGPFTNPFEGPGSVSVFPLVCSDVGKKTGMSLLVLPRPNRGRVRGDRSVISCNSRASTFP